MRKYILVLIVMLCLPIFQGCASLIMTKYDNSFYQPTLPANVKIFHNDPPGDFIKIGEVFISSTKNGPLSRLLIEIKLKKLAAGSGGDAVIVKRDHYFDVSMHKVSSTSDITAVIIKFKEQKNGNN